MESIHGAVTMGTLLVHRLRILLGTALCRLYPLIIYTISKYHTLTAIGIPNMHTNIINENVFLLQIFIFVNFDFLIIASIEKVIFNTYSSTHSFTRMQTNPFTRAVQGGTETDHTPIGWT